MPSDKRRGLDLEREHEMANKAKKTPASGSTKSIKQTPEDRREFLKKAGTVAAAAPAVTLLLSAKAKRAHAVASPGNRDDDGISCNAGEV